MAKKSSSPWARIGHRAQPPPPYLPTPTFLSFDMSKTLFEMLPGKKGTNYMYVDRLYGGTLKTV